MITFKNMKTAPLVSIIIVGFNAKHFLPKCLSSLVKSSYKNIEILYIDNGSSDGSCEYLEKYYPQVILVRHSKNLGFSPAHEGILKHVKGEAVLLLNTDTILEKNLLSELVNALYEKNDIGAVQPKILMYPKSSQIDSIGSFFLLNGLLYHYGYEKNEKPPIYNSRMEIFSTKGAIMLARKDVLEKVSFKAFGRHDASIFDCDYFTAFEDTDLSMRIWLSGYKILYVPTARGYHIGGGTNNKARKSFIVFHGEKNRLATYIKNLSIQYLCKVLPRMFLMLQVEFLVYLLFRKNVGSAIAIEKAILWNFFHIRDTLRKRKFIQNTVRLVPDNSFLPMLTKSVRLSYYYYLMVGLDRYKD